MRPHHAVVAVVAILAMAAAVVAGGRAVRHDENDGHFADQIQAGVDAVPGAPVTAAIQTPELAKPAAHSRAIAPRVSRRRNFLPRSLNGSSHARR